MNHCNKLRWALENSSLYKIGVSSVKLKGVNTTFESSSLYTTTVFRKG